MKRPPVTSKGTAPVQPPGPVPIFSCESHPELGDNINGPSVIRAPAWLEDPPGAYLLYFAHHQGDHIRLAHADSPLGEWRLRAGGCLRLSDVPAIHDHIASPDVVVDDDARELRMYFHGYRAGTEINPDRVSEGQATFCARSRDGRHFRAEAIPLGPYYMRVFREAGAWYAIAKDGYRGSVLLRSGDGLSPFVPGPPLLPRSRHVGLERDDEGRLWVYFSRIGDKPERILKSELLMKGAWDRWRCGPVREVKAPALDWEGADCPSVPSAKGVTYWRVRQLRDPAVLRDGGERYLYYSFAGESGLAVVRLP